ncbi:MAG: YihY/virulence factor BrkB family protein [Rhizobiaceae bacterium]
MIGFLQVFWNASTRLTYDGGLANAGNIALSLLLSLFPFMILIATFVDVWGDPTLLEEILVLMFDHWPAGSAAPIAEQMKIVLGQAKGELITIGNLIALVLATNGIESARDGLNRAYRFVETRNFMFRRLQGAIFVCIGALGLILAAFILVGTPVVWSFLVSKLSWLSQFSFAVGLVQYGLAILLLVTALFCFHYFLPAGSLKGGEVIWGILLTIAGILIGSQFFAIYLKEFANYTNLYAGLAGVMIVIVYLYCLSVLILFGAEFNAALKHYRSGSQKTNMS